MPRLSIQVEGIVQGVGFRPFVYQLANSLGLTGWVRNDVRGVNLEVEGSRASLDQFVHQLKTRHPPLASLARLKVNEITNAGEAGFIIKRSEAGLSRETEVAPDTYVCPDCLSELFNPEDRRYRYPFINCTNCGPRYTIITDVPYDRPSTTMADFPMCSECLREYEDPHDRRFHAQPNACSTCGPQLEFLESHGEKVACCDPLKRCAEKLAEGSIVAIKGIGGFHLAVDAGNDDAVRELRQRKKRDEKPFALMVRDMQALQALVEISSLEERLLQSWERPIVLLTKKPNHGLAESVAPLNRYFGVMLPYAPVHHLLLEDFPALVMTSANLSDEPIMYDNAQAVDALSRIADGFLLHDRRIHTRCDDSIARVMAGEPLLLRRSRGYAPRAIYLARQQVPTLALGAELKNTICLVKGDRAYLSQHIGDLKNAETFQALETMANQMLKLLDVYPQVIAHDLHPDYLSTRVAQGFGDHPRVAVQHHHAHLAAVLAEHGCEEPVIGAIFDGLGLGDDGTIWGGEFLIGDILDYRRVGHFDYLSLPGGDVANREPRRMGLSALAYAYGDDLPEHPLLKCFTDAELKLLIQMMGKGINTPLTSSCGRLFDAISALAGLRYVMNYEGQAALELEMVRDLAEKGVYPYAIAERNQSLVFEPRDLIRSVVEDSLASVSPGIISARFHNTLVAMVCDVCNILRNVHGLSRVALSGGVFQNLALLEQLSISLEMDGFTVLRHRQVPPNDGGLSLGQAVIAGARWQANRVA